jgi:phage terminase large subunit
VPHLQLGAIRDFKNIMIDRNMWRDECWSEGRIYTFSNGCSIEFVSFDKFGKAHGPRRDVLFLNEALHIPYNIADQLITRTRKIVWMDWNPSEEFWFYTEMVPNRKDIDLITLNYLDNEALDPIAKAEIESHKHNKQWWTVYGLGQLGEITSRIYTSWSLIDDIPKEARLERYGLDFGYTNDPTAIVAVYYFNGGWILDEKVYKRGMSNKEIADTLKTLEERLVIADSAEPKSIDEIRSYGLNVQACQKGKDSVRTGIQLIQDQPISITKRSINGIKEYRNYLWIVDKDGRVLNEPEKGNDHFLDATRYAMETLGRLKQEESYWDRIYHDELSNQPAKKSFNKGK